MNELISTFHLGGQGPKVAIKDCINIEGMVTSGASKALANGKPAAKHADVVEALLKDDWQIVAKANMHEIAYGMTGINQFTGTPTNPQDPDRIPGGSSSGSAAAVGAGLVDMALGSDTGGSIRLPAACCGVVGMKPTFGRVSRIGAYPQYTTLDCIGPFTRDVDMLIRAMNSITPAFDNTAARQPVKHAHVGLLKTNSNPLITATIENCIQHAGLSASTLDLSHGMQSAFDASITLINLETWCAFGYLTGLDLYGDDIEKRLLMASKTTEAARQIAEQQRFAFSAQVDQALTECDALILPTLPDLAPTFAELSAGVSMITMSAHVRPFNVSGHPAITLPISIQGSHVKAGLQLVGRKNADEQLCALALHLEQFLRNQ